MPAYRARAPLRLVLSGDEVAGLGPLVASGNVVVALEARATVEVRRRDPGEWRSRVRGFGRTLLVEPDLPPPVADEGALAVEAFGLRDAPEATREGPLEVTVDAPDAPDLGSFEARAEALAACLDALAKARTGLVPGAAAARAGSPSGVLLAGAPPNRPSPGVSRALEARLVLVRDRHAAPGPSARLVALAWHSGDSEKRAALERAARASRAAAEVARGQELGGLPGILADEANALEAVAPRAKRERLLEAALAAAGARVVRPLGERGLLALVLASPDDRERLLAKASELNLEMVSSRFGPADVSVEEVSP